MPPRMTTMRAVSVRRKTTGAWLPLACTAAMLALMLLSWVRGSIYISVLPTIGFSSLIAPGPVYTVAEAERRLTLDPAAWNGRTVLIRARAVIYLTWRTPDGIVTRTDFIDGAWSRGAKTLAVVRGNPDSLLVSLRRLPLIGVLAPRPQRLHWRASAVYRVQILCAPGCAPRSDDAVLLDAAPE